MKCPKCESAMTSVVAAGGEDAFRCGGCGGIFCGKRTLDLLQRHWDMWPRSDPRSIDSGTPRKDRLLDTMTDVRCPHCAARMVRSEIPEQPHISVDRCMGCGGVYFDAGELTDLRYLTFADWIRKLRHKTSV